MDKAWYKSKAIWGSAFVILGAAYGYISGELATAEVIVSAGLGIMGIGIRMAE